MSQYRDLVSDLPRRCSALLDEFYSQATDKKLEVTFLLTVATICLTIPLERLRDKNHPSGDTLVFSKAKQQFDRLRGQKFIGSVLWNESVTGSWKYVPEMESVAREPDYWKELKTLESLQNEIRVDKVLRHIRNALAHGNLFTRGNPINQLILLTRQDPSEKIELIGSISHRQGVVETIKVKNIAFETEQNFDYKYSLLSVSPSDFHTFIKNWLNFLETLKVSGRAVI